MKIVKVVFMDDEYPNLDTYHLIDPDERKLAELKRAIETRFDYEDDDTLSTEEYEYKREIANEPWEFIDLFISMNFKTLDISEVVEINY